MLACADQIDDLVLIVIALLPRSLIGSKKSRQDSFPIFSSYKTLLITVVANASRTVAQAAVTTVAILHIAFPEAIRTRNVFGPCCDHRYVEEAECGSVHNKSWSTPGGISIPSPVDRKLIQHCCCRMVVMVYVGCNRHISRTVEYSGKRERESYGHFHPDQLLYFCFFDLNITARWHKQIA